MIANLKYWKKVFIFARVYQPCPCSSVGKAACQPDRKRQSDGKNVLALQ
jgi:hypothetical protein